MSARAVMEYGRQPKRRWGRLLFWWGVGVLSLLAAGALTVAALVWLAFRSMAEVNLVVVNASSARVDSVGITDGREDGGDAYLAVEAVPVGERRSARWHMPTTLGPAAVVVRTSKGVSVREAGYLLDDDGPYTFRVTVRDDGIEIWRDNNEAPVTWTMPPATRPN